MNTTLVLEIGNLYLKMAVFRSAISVTYLKNLAAINIANFSEDVIAEDIANYLKELNIKKPQNILISFSRNAVTLRNLRIPSVNPSEIDDMIKLHVGRQVPYAKEEIVSGYRIIGRDTMGYSKVMLAIVHRENIRRIFKILEKAGLYTDSIELSSDGVLSWLCRAAKAHDAKSGEVFIVLDVDANFTDFIVSSYENILFSRVIALGNEHLADKEKWPKFLGEMKQAIVISQGEEILQKPSRIYLAGAGTFLKELAGAVETEFNLTTQVVESMENLPLAKDISQRPQDLLKNVSLSSLIGLGLDTARKKINFVLPEAQIRRTLHERTRDVVFLGSGIMYLILIVCGIYLEKVHNKKVYLALLNDRYKSIAVSAEDLSEKVQRIEKIKSKLDTSSVVLNFLQEISKLLPPEIVITNISFQKDEKMAIRGRSVEMSDIFKFIKTLEDSLYFKDIQTRYTTRKKFKGVDVNEFELVCPFEKVKEAKKEKKPAVQPAAAAAKEG